MTLRTSLIVSGDSASARKALADLNGAIAKTEQQTAKTGATAGAVGTQMAASAQASARAAVGAGAGYTVLTNAVHGNTIAMRESLVVSRELLSGNMTRLPGSLSILAQQFSLSGKSAGDFAKQILSAFGILATVGDEELTAAAASAAATAAIVRGSAERAQGAIVAADAELLLAEAAVNNAEGSDAEAAAQERLAAAHQMVADAAAEAAIAEDALAVAEEGAGVAAAEAGAVTTVALGPVGIALGIAAAAALPLIEAFKDIKAAIDQQKLDDFAASMHLSASEAAGLNDNVVKLVEKLEKNAADARDAALAHEIYANSAQGAISSVDDLTKHILAQNNTLEQNIALQQSSLAGGFQKGASDLQSKAAAARKQLSDAQAAYSTAVSLSGSGDDGGAAISLAAKQLKEAQDNALGLARSMNTLAGNGALVARAINQTNYPLYTRNAKEAADATAAINRRFDDQVKKAEQAGTYTQALADSIEQQRQKALAAAQATDAHSGAIGRHAAAARADKPEVDKLAASVGQLLDQLFPVRAAQDELAKDTDLLTKAWKAGAIGADEYAAAIAAAQAKFAGTISPPTVDIGDYQPLGKQIPDLEQTIKSLPQVVDATNDWKKSIQSIARDDLRRVNDELASAIVNSKSLGATFHDVAQQMEQDLIKLALEEAETAIFKALGLPTLNFGGGRASGGSVSPGSFYTVNERSTAPGLFIPLAPGVIQPPGNDSAPAASGAGAPAVVQLVVTPSDMFEVNVANVANAVVDLKTSSIVNQARKTTVDSLTRKRIGG